MQNDWVAAGLEMGGVGVDARMAILADAVERHILDLLPSQGWTGRIAENNPHAEYVVVEAQRGDLTKRVALLYSASTDTAHLRALAESVDAAHSQSVRRSLRWP